MRVCSLTRIMGLSSKGQLIKEVGTRRVNDVGLVPTFEEERVLRSVFCGYLPNLIGIQKRETPKET